MKYLLSRAQTCTIALGIALAGAGAAQAQEGSGDAGRPAFAIDVRAPAPIKSLLDRHLELRRYREVTDLDDTELARLIVMAERDVRELVGTLGYFDPRIVVRRDEASKTSPLIVIEVEPGKFTEVSEVKIEFEGDVMQSTDPGVARQREEIRSGWRLPIGQRFTQEGWDQAKSTALRQLMARRYPVSRISHSLADIDAPNARAGLGLKLDSGPPYRLGEMVVTGVNRYDPVLVPRIARLPVGSSYDQEALVQAQLRLAGSGYFDSAFILLATEGDPNAAPVQVTVREAPLHKLVLGLGVSTDSGARASVEYRNNRVPVIGWRAVTKLQLERKSPFVETEWTAVPGTDGWRWGVLARAERVDDGVLVTNGQKLRVGRTWVGDHIERNVYAQYERANVRAAAGAAAAIPDNGDGAAISANYVWTGRYFDRSLYPTRGYGVGFELGGGLTLTGTRSPFQRTLVRWLGVRPLQSGRLQFRAEAGAVIAKAAAKMPASQLFRTGGDTTVRGYGYREIGVERPGGVVGPGRFMAVGSVEWQQPIKRGGLETEWESAVFIDGGAVSDRIGGLKPVFGVGAGARWKSPLGPLQVDLAYGIKPRKFRLHFNLGVTF